MVQGYGIVNSNGALWKEQRAFLHWALREIGAKNCGPRRSILEESIKEEVDKFLRILAHQRGKTCHIRSIVVRCVSNVVGSLLMSVKYSEGDSRFPRLLHLIEEGFRLLTIAIPVNFIPVLRYFPLCSYPYYKLQKNRKETESYFQEVANDHRKSLNFENARDFIDMYLIRLNKIKEEHKFSYFSEQQLLQILGDMFSAGLETVTTLLEWSVIYMVAYREVQKLVQKEMDEKIGRQRLPTLADLPNLPYTEATILEIMRRANVVAIGPAHATLQETELGGYKIPKGTHIVPNLWAVHMDPKLWPEPENFKPERFLQDGKVHVPSYFMPFSVGRRRCVGDTLTKMEVFMFLSSMLHQFHVRIPDGEKPPELNGKVAASLTSIPYKVCVHLRDSLLL
ncbi:cytochrome P450 18a1-like [Centruroides vittatus]|uniref:cytochrome P450 18a1-like n=1 Tax=Centruroides vittatus TaxID=120091 RepID=UPI00350F7180